jgi:hypothetical protein
MYSVLIISKALFMKNYEKSKFSLQQVMASLSAAAYMPFQSMIKLQDNLTAIDALEQAYTAVWWDRTSTAAVFVAKNKFTNDYAVVFKGEVFRPTLSFLVQLYEDLNVGHQQSFPYTRLGAAKVAAGILNTLQDIGNSIYGGRTLQQVLNNLPRRTKVYVAGHSLGGSLATAYAAKTICSNSAELDIIPYTFGAPSIGNDSFADLFDPDNINFLFSQSSRCINSRDILPNAWSNLAGITTVDYGSVKCSVEFNLCIEYLERLLILSRVFYSQPPVELQLKGDDRGMDNFFRKAAHQHEPNTYLKLLGLDPIESAEFYHSKTEEFILSDTE